MKELEPQTLRVYPDPCPSEDDEISLVDLWFIFKKHYKAFVYTFLIVTIVGLAIILSVPKKYDLKTSLEIGSSLQNDVPTPIEAPETVKAKLENSFIPMVINRLSGNDEEGEKYEVAVQIPKKSTLVVLKSSIKESDERRYTVFHDEIIDAIVSDHRRLINVLKKKIETQLEFARIKLAELSDPATLEATIGHEKKKLEEARSALARLTDPVIFGTRLKKQQNQIKDQENRLASLKDQQRVLSARLKRIASQQELIRNEIETLQRRIDESLSLQIASAKQAGDASSAMSQLLIDSQIAEDRKWLAKLKEKLYIDLENKKAEVEKALLDNARSQELAQARLDQVKSELEKLKSSNKLDQTELRARINEIEATMKKIINNQRRKVKTQEQVVEELLSKLNNFVETRAVVAPTRSPEPTSIPRSLMLLLVLFLGTIFAAFAVIIGELRDRIRERETAAEAR